MTGRMIALLALLGMTSVSPVLADGHTLQPDFTFKRIGVPSSGGGSRINVQIEPQVAVVTAAPAAAAAAASSPTSLPMAWFWNEISPKLEDSQPGRLRTAVVAIANAPDGQGVPAPRLQLMQDIAKEHGTEILRASVGTRVSPALVLAVIAVESAGKADAGSSAGAQGLMQLMPATAARFGVTDSFDAADNIKGGIAYLDWLMGEFDGDPILVLAGYNAGEGSVRNNTGVPPYAETRAYVPKVLAAWSVARGLCLTPPELATDGCVFAIMGG